MKCLLLFLLFSLPAYAGVEQLSEQEFLQLAADLAPKVNLFQEVWKQDPEAEFYGGTSRDFLYWIKGRFKDAKTRADAEKIARELKAKPIIDLRSFVIAESDVDVISKKQLSLNVSQYDVRKIDTQPADIFQPNSEAGFNELHQGYAPAEKIRLGARGLIPNPALGNGAGEIYSGRLTVHFASAEDFAKTKYAKEGINHPVLLAMRYIRLQAMNYYQTHGDGLPDTRKLIASLDPESSEAVAKVVRDSLDGELVPFLKKDKFRSWINGAIQKAFRSYANPTAARDLMQHFQVDLLIDKYSPEIQPINQYLFSKHRNQARIAARFLDAKVDPARALLAPESVFSDGFLYHGTGTEPAFRAILIQGALPSGSGAAGAGLYGVNVENKSYSEAWGGSPDRLIKLPVSKDAKIMDIISDGPGKNLWDKWGKPMDFDGFADAYGIDILRYPYDGQDAYVVKNGSVLGRPTGVYRQALTLDELLNKVATITDPAELYSLIAVDSLRELVFQRTKIPERKFLELMAKTNDRSIIKSIGSQFVGESQDKLNEVASMVSEPSQFFDRIFKIMNTTPEMGSIAFSHSHIPPEMMDQYLAALKTEDTFDIIKYVLPYSQRPDRLEIVERLLARGQSSNLLRYVLSKPAWDDENGFVNKFLLSEGYSPTRQQNAIRELAKAGYWERRPDFLRSLVGVANENLKNGLLLSYLNDRVSFPGVWERHRDIFLSLMENTGVTNKYGPAISPLKDALIHERSLVGRPEYFLEFLRHISQNKKFRAVRKDLIEKCLQRPDGLYHDLPYFRELTAGHPENAEALLAAWERERKKAAVKKRIKAYEEREVAPYASTCPAGFKALVP